MHVDPRVSFLTSFIEQILTECYYVQNTVKQREDTRPQVPENVVMHDGF